MRKWFSTAWTYNRTYHTVPVLLLAGGWVVNRLLHRRLPQPAPADSLVWLLLAFAAVHVGIGRGGCYVHAWWWWPVTPALAVCAALSLDELLALLTPRFLHPTAAYAMLGILAFAFAVRCLAGVLPWFFDPAVTCEGKHYSGLMQAAAVRFASADSNSAVILVSPDDQPNLWYYADRPIKTQVWDTASLLRRMADDTADLPFGFTQKWPGRPVAVVVPKEYQVPELRGYLQAHYRQLSAPGTVGELFDIFDLYAPIE